MNELNFLLQGEKPIQKEKTIAYKAPHVLIIFLTAVAVVSLDTFFLGIGLTMALLKSFRWATILVFLLKLSVDVAVFATWFFLVKEKTDRAKFSTVIETQGHYFVIWQANGESGFVKFKIDETSISVKRGLLRKIYGVYTIRLACEDKVYKCDFSIDKRQRVDKIFKIEK